MVKIRLRRTGKSHDPSYQLVVISSTTKRDGKYIDKIGHFSPKSDDCQMKKERILFWLKRGAQPTTSALNLIKRQKIWADFMKGKITKTKKKS